MAGGPGSGKRIYHPCAMSGTFAMAMGARRCRHREKSSRRVGFVDVGAAGKLRNFEAGSQRIPLAMLWN